MKIRGFWHGLALSIVATAACAHAHLIRSTPADGSTIGAPPARVQLAFSEAARITAAWIQKGSGARQKLEPLPEAAAIEASIALPALEPGTYVISWRALSDDGHVMPGEIRFTLTPSR